MASVPGETINLLNVGILNVGDKTAEIKRRVGGAMP